MRFGSRPPEGSTSRRRARRGATSRSSRSGQAAKSTATPTPSARPTNATCRSGRKRELDGQELRHERRQHRLHAEPHRHTEHATRQPERRGLHEVDGRHIARARAEGAEHRGGIELLLHEDAHTRGHADATEEQCRQPDQPEEPRQQREALREVFLVARHRARRGALDAEELLRLFEPRAEVGARLHVAQVLDHRALLHEARGFEVRGRQEDPRRHRGPQPEGARRLARLADHGEGDAPDAQRLAHLRVELDEHGRVDHRHRFVLCGDRVPCPRRLGDDLSIEGEARLQRLHVPRAACGPSARPGPCWRSW